MGKNGAPISKKSAKKLTMEQMYGKKGVGHVKIKNLKQNLNLEEEEQSSSEQESSEKSNESEESNSEEIDEDIITE